MIDIEKTIERVKQLKHLKRQEDVANLVKLSPSNFSTRKGRGTLFEPFIEWAFHENVNLDWLFYGEGKAHSYNTSFKTNEFLQKTEYILQADHPKITLALKQNINVFYDALLTEIMPLKKKPKIPVKQKSSM